MDLLGRCCATILIRYRVCNRIQLRFFAAFGVESATRFGKKILFRYKDLTIFPILLLLPGFYFQSTR